jgi:hypothetical protein
MPTQKRRHRAPPHYELLLITQMVSSPLLEPTGNIGGVIVARLDRKAKISGRKFPFHHDLPKRGRQRAAK